MAKKPNSREFSEKESQDRLSATLRGAFAGPPTTLKERRKAKSDTSSASAKTSSRRKKNPA